MSFHKWINKRLLLYQWELIKRWSATTSHNPEYFQRGGSGGRGGVYGCMESSPAPLRASVIVQRERVQASQARSWRKRVGWLSLCRRQEATAAATGGGCGGGCSPGGFVDSCFCTWMHEHRCSAERPLSPVSSIHHSAVLNVPGLSPQSHGIILAVHTVNI